MAAHLHWHGTADPGAVQGHRPQDRQPPPRLRAGEGLATLLLQVPPLLLLLLLLPLLPLLLLLFQLLSVLLLLLSVATAALAP